MRKLLVTCLLVLCLTPTASAKKWPVPPSWWLNSRDMVAVRQCESGNGKGGRNLYGMLDAWAEVGGKGSAWNASKAEQHYRAWLFWRRHGCHAGWGVWDGCC